MHKNFLIITYYFAQYDNSHAISCMLRSKYSRVSSNFFQPAIKTNMCQFLGAFYERRRWREKCRDGNLSLYREHIKDPLGDTVDI